MKDISPPCCQHRESCDMVPLCLMRAGQTAHVGDVLGCPDMVHRLREMGLRSGASIQMVRPGSPCIIRLDGQKLCFRADEVASILVHVGGAPAPC